VPPLIELKNLVKHFEVGRSTALPWRPVHKVMAVNGVSFQVGEGEVLGLVGESGSGKSTVGRCILGLETPTSGEIWLGGRLIQEFRGKSVRMLRREVQMVFQDYYGALNPRLTVAEIVEEPLVLLTESGASDRKRKVEDVLRDVDVSKDLMFRYRHQLSGGQQQRVNIARALVIQPRFVVLDEPVSSIDASVRGQILDLLKDLRQRHGLSYLLISHDLQTVRNICNHVAIMYGGRIVEFGKVDQIFESPLHPYTTQLLSSILVPEPRRVRERRVAQVGSSSHMSGGREPARQVSQWLSDPRWGLIEDKHSNPYPDLVEVAAGHYVAARLVPIS
jgi:ABC-type oligopeptide transport system ATPase subunit